MNRRSALLTLAGAACANAQTPLDRFVGRDLEKTAPTKDPELFRLIGTVPKGFIMEPWPWRVWKTTSDHQTRYVVLLVESILLIPGGSSACVQLFDAAAKKLNSWNFQTGWRTTPVEASFEPLLGRIALRMGRAVNGGNVAREYYGIGGDQLKLIRLEDDQNRAVQNEYVYPNLEIGVVPERRSVTEWATLLDSADESDILSALVFLGGRHFSEPQPSLLSVPTESAYADFFQALIADATIRQTIERLTHSDRRWIREAAILAARGPRDRPFAPVN